MLKFCLYTLILHSAWAGCDPPAWMEFDSYDEELEYIYNCTPEKPNDTPEYTSEVEESDEQTSVVDP
jgi:hypothetical protein